MILKIPIMLKRMGKGVTALNSHKQFHIRKLSIELLISVIIAVSIGILVFFLVRNGFFIT